MSVPQDVKLDTTKSSPLAHGAKQGAMLPAPADPDKPAPFGMGTPTSDDKNGTPKRTPNEHVKDPTSNHKSPPLGQRGPSLGHQDRRGGSMHPWSSDSAAPQAASAAFRPRMQQTPSPKTTMSGKFSTGFAPLTLNILKETGGLTRTFSRARDSFARVERTRYASHWREQHQYQTSWPCLPTLPLAHGLAAVDQAI